MKQHFERQQDTVKGSQLPLVSPKILVTYLVLLITFKKIQRWLELKKGKIMAEH